MPRLPQTPTKRVSVGPDGRQGNGISLSPSLSASGFSVAFESKANNLVPRDTNRESDVFVYGMTNGRTTRVSVSTTGRQSNGESRGAKISADGRFVAFYSFASNLVPGDSNAAVDIFLHERASGTTTRISVGSDEAQANSDSLFPALSADARYVAFNSAASNLVAGDTNGWTDIFLRDRDSWHNHQDERRQQRHPRERYERQACRIRGRPVCGLHLLRLQPLPGNSNGTGDIFVRDRLAGTTSRVSISTGEAQGNGQSQEAAISATGRFVAFESEATNLVPGDTNAVFDVFIRDRDSGTTSRASVANDGSQANDHSQSLALSADGRFVAFSSSASNLVPNDTNNATDVFIRDRHTGTTRRVSLTAAGGQSNGFSLDPTLSADASLVGFASTARNLVPGDTNRKFDVFVRSR